MRRVPVVALVLAVLLAACGGVQELTLPPMEAVPTPATTVADQVTGTGVVRVAYPAEPAAFVDVDGSDPAAIDLAALWGVPLFRIDAQGQRVAALAQQVRTAELQDGGWTVTVDLRSGTWTDGTPVTSEDVAATVASLRPVVPELAALREVRTPSPDQVVLEWDRVVAGWWRAVDAAGSILPASVVTEGGLAAYEDALPLTAGPFALQGRDVGRSMTFAAHAGSPLGAPVSARIELLVSNSYETSLGLLEDGQVDVVLGHLALNPVPRGVAVGGVSAAAPVGGTTVTLEFRPDGPVGAPEDAAVRRGIIASIRLGPLVEGLLGSVGELATSPWPAGPSTVVAAEAADPSGRQAVTVLPRGHEVIGFTARAVQRDVEGVGVDMQFVSFEAPTFQVEADTQGAASFRIRRDGPRPLLGPRGTQGIDPVPVILSMAGIDGPEVISGLQQATDTALVVPLYRVGVAHVWRDDLAGFAPSSWPGLAFTTAATWSR